MIKLIVTDLDNTLLQNDKSISENTISTLIKCQKKGIKIAFATARSIQASSKFLDQFTPDVFIGYGGSISFADDKVISRFAISSEISTGLINKCLQEPEILYILAINEFVAYTNKINPLDKESSHYKCVDFSLHNDISYLKISLVADNPDVVKNIAVNYPDLDLFRYSNENLYRFANRNALKWNAVKAVVEYYDINIDMVAAFGDDINDLEMIKNSGIGIAVRNAVDEVKKVAKYICESNNSNGVAKWIEEQIL